jgi:hypothetical protein
MRECMPAWGVIVFPTSGILITEVVFIWKLLWNRSNTWILEMTREIGYLVDVQFSQSDGVAGINISRVYPSEMCKVTEKVEGCLFAGFGFFSFCERRVFAFHCTRLLLYTDRNFTVLFLYLQPFRFPL